MEIVGSDYQKDQEKQDQAVQELVEHLKSIAPFNKRWQVKIPWNLAISVEKKQKFLNIVALAKVKVRNLPDFFCWLLINIKNL